ncbi:MAG TPA: M20/M25/M40 family metallo-hydrolase [Gemmatimonadaceae bacterium]|nr:M20/M25/M40 family metallo-hydrolase [Gemmatimonadaceae bacterium]
MEADRTSVEAETLGLLQALIRFDTTNPPGNELPLAEFLRSVFEKDGVSTILLLPAPSRAALIARLKGNGKKRPVMLLAHMDVVGVEADKWSCDPFGGIVRDGYLYGRGAIDDKGMLAANAMALLQVKRSIIDNGGELDRDIVFVATSDEESGGADGMKWLVDNHPGHLDAEFAINEGGRTRIIEGGRRYLAIQTAEKISHKVVVTARGPAGHAAVPLEGNAVFQLGAALVKLAAYREPVTLNATTSRFFGELSKVWPAPDVAEAMRNVVSQDVATSDAAAMVLSRIPVFNAVMRNGISPVGLSGGVAGNVIPAEVTAILNVRTIPGHDIGDVVDRIREAIGTETVSVELASHGEEAPGSDPDSVMFQALAASAQAIDPDISVVPYLSTGGTDSAHLRRLGIDAYGILPFPMEQSDEERMHGHDERVPVQSLHFGTRLIFESIRRVAEA